MTPQERLLAATLDLTHAALEKPEPRIEGWIVERADLGLTPSGWSRCFHEGRSVFALRSECHAAMEANGPEHDYRITPLGRMGPIEHFPATVYKPRSTPWPRTLSHAEEGHQLAARQKRSLR